MDRLNEANAMTIESGSANARSAVRPMATVHLDLDGATHIFKLHGWNWSGGEDPVYESGVQHALDLFDEFGIRATFFVIAEDLKHPAKAKCLREIRRRGHDLGSHSLTHSPLRALTTEQKRTEIFTSREYIAAELGCVPSGFRAPNFSIDAQSLDLIAEAGYTYDSSIIPGARVPGMIASGALAPEWIRDKPGLVELPLPAHRPLPFSFHPSYSLVLGLRYFRWGMRRFSRSRAPLVMLFHLIDFADPLPERATTGWAQRVFTLSHISGARKRDGCRRMLEAVANAYDILDTSDIVNRTMKPTSRPQS